MFSWFSLEAIFLPADKLSSSVESDVSSPTRIRFGILRLSDRLHDGKAAEANKQTNGCDSSDKGLIEFETESSSRAGHDESIVNVSTRRVARLQPGSKNHPGRIEWEFFF